MQQTECKKCISKNNVKTGFSSKIFHCYNKTNQKIVNLWLSFFTVIV